MRHSINRSISILFATSHQSPGSCATTVPEFIAYAKANPGRTSTILRNRLYTGWFEWNGKLIQGRHEPLVSVELWERVQDMMMDASRTMPSAAGATSPSRV
jgi:hypothetical protein